MNKQIRETEITDMVIKKYVDRLTNEELNDFTSRVVVQLEPTLTQQVMSLILELTEYRTKIENGTLIELPCKMGETFYEIDTLYCEYYEHGVGGFSFEDGELIIIDFCDSRYKASEVCFSQAEAEQKLKELKV